MRDGPVGTIYLYHFDRPYKHAKHYLGWTEDLAARHAEHQAGNGARLLAVVRAAGIEYQLVRTWEEVTRAEERRLKNFKGATRLCPHPTCREIRRQRTKKWPKKRRSNDGG